MNILKILTPSRITGNAGEKHACRYLRKNGYKILERNYVACGNEIDIIARNKDTLCFIEVKTRNIKSDESLLARPASAVNKDKQAKLIQTAKFYLGAAKYDPRLRDLRVRFDVIEVYMQTSNGKQKITDIVHMEGAFRQT